MDTSKTNAVTTAPRKSRTSCITEPVNKSLKSIQSDNMAIKGSELKLKTTSRLKVRKQSYGFSSVPGVRPVERTSQGNIEYKRPPMLYYPTYQLEPHKRFHIVNVKAMCNEIINEIFVGHKYNEQESPVLALKIAGEVMRRTKMFNFNRYRILVIVTVGQKRAQSYNNAIAFVWDYERDAYVNVQAEEPSVFVQITVFGIYLD